MRRLIPLLVLTIVATPALAQTPGEDDGAETTDAGAAPSAVPSASASSVVPHPSVKRVEKDGMMLVPAGRFTMGTNAASAASNEKPPHPETVASFWIDKTEVTVGAYRACVEAKRCEPPRRSSPLCTFTMGDDALPINCVRFADADGYCRHVGKRLPREVEWEYAARGTTGARYPWGGAASSCAAAATLTTDQTGRSCTGLRPRRVGAYVMGASPFGALDMAGNVEEWTADWYVEHVLPGAAPHMGSSHVLRGGGWLSGPSASTTTSRNWGSVVESGPNVGFRCARSDPEASR